MPANQASLDEFLLGNTTADNIRKVSQEEESKKESKMGEQSQNKNEKNSKRNTNALKKKGSGTSPQSAARRNIYKNQIKIVPIKM